MLKTKLLGEILGRNYKPSNEDSIQSEQVGNSGDAVVEIERLKAVHLDTMDIHALEQDIAIIEQEGAAADELSEATTELTEIKAEIESYYEKGGMSASDAFHLNKRISYIDRRLGYGLNLTMPSTESFRGNDADRMTLTASLENAVWEKIKELWKAFKDMMVRIFNKIKEFFGFGKKKASDAEEKLEKKAEENKNKEGTGTLALPPPAATSLANVEKVEDIATVDEESGKAVVKQGTEAKMIDAIENLCETTKKYLQGVEIKNLVSNLEKIVDAGMAKADSKQNPFGEDVITYLELISKSYTGKELPKASSNEWKVSSDTLLGGYVINMSAKSDKANDKYTIPVLSATVDPVVEHNPKIKQVELGSVECKAYATMAKKVAVVMSTVKMQFENSEAAMDKYLKYIELIEQEVKDKDAKYANFALAFTKFAGNAVKSHPAKSYCTKAIDFAVTYSSSFKG